MPDKLAQVCPDSCKVGKAPVAGTAAAFGGIATLRNRCHPFTRAPLRAKTRRKIMIEVSTIPALVDELTSLQTQIAVLTARADQIKADLIDVGPGEYCGSVTRVVVSNVPECKTTDWKALAQSFEPSDAQLRQYVVTKKAYSKAVTYGYNARKAA